MVIVPPKHPNLSIRITSAPALAAPIAAESPDGPPPTTKISQESKIFSNFGCSCTFNYPASVYSREKDVLEFFKISVYLSLR